jgi:serine/threonine-protein kinase
MGFVAPGEHGSREGTDTQLPPKRRSKALRNVAFIVGGVAVTIAVALIAWTQLGSDPPVRMGTSTSASETATPPPPPSTSSATSPGPTGSASAHPEAPAPAWMTQVREAQQAIASGDVKVAHKLLKEAFDRASGHGLPRTMMEHLAAATAGGGSCRLTGLARPRSYDLASASMKPLPAGRPSIAVTPKGAVITWTDAHEGPEHAFTAALDDALRNTGTPVDVTPDGLNVGHPELKRLGDKLVLAWGDAKGPEAGVRARFLDAEGKPAGAPVAVTPPRPGTYWPAIAAANDGTVFLAWADEGDSDSEDLFLRRLSPTLEPAPELVRATDLIGAGAAKARVRAPSIAVAGESLLAAYRMEREPLHLIHELRVRVADTGKGLEPAKKGDRRAERNLGEVVLVNSDKAKSDGPSIACGPAACYLAWFGEGAAGGASAAYVDPARSQPVWRRKFSRTGTRPAVAVSPTTGQAQLVWFEGGKVLTASITREGVGTPTKIARVSGDQPTPSIVAGNRPGEWYVAWLDYETGHLEAYAARVQCK